MPIEWKKLGRPHNREKPGVRIGSVRVVRKLKQLDAAIKHIDGRTRMLAAGLRELLMLDEDYVSLVACKDDVDHVVLNALREARHVGKQPSEIAAELGIDHRDVSRRIYAMNKRMKEEIEEVIITKKGSKWRLIKKLRRDFAATRPSATEEKSENSSS